MLCTAEITVLLLGRDYWSHSTYSGYCSTGVSTYSGYWSLSTYSGYYGAWSTRICSQGLAVYWTSKFTVIVHYIIICIEVMCVSVHQGAPETRS